MIFLPNNFENYCYRLRNTLQFLIIKNGYKPRYLENLKKIHQAEALYSTAKTPIEINSFTTELLKAVFLKKLESNEKFNFNIKTNGTFLINKKLYTSFLLCICKNSHEIEILQMRGNIAIIFDGQTPQKTKKFLNVLKGYLLKDIKSNRTLTVIPLEKTDKNPLKTEKDWEYILNPLSEVNIYLN